MARPLKPKLSTNLIARGALALVDQAGEFTIPDLAKRLKVSPSSLYNHVTGKSDIVELMRGHMIAQVKIPAGTGVWHDTITAIAREYRNAYAKHPRVIPLIAAYSVRDETTIRMYNILADAFASAGFTPRRTLEAITVIDNYVLGSALDVAAPEEVWAPDDGANAALAAALKEGMGYPNRADDAFDFGLDIIMDGLRREAEAGGRPRDR
ncbi:TetR/AcrR family transcriptional regulator C-terminal domain-containing protein [Arthrobacter sp. H5]|uniref:TetR/AcrR family transcriptional regulator C-terminal domain-containing protein n=1 Tax=Arthrobacter sp. H5 TaxID=1267973 RepID=UPI00047F49D4|nr:TetR/AcrR family transcriptional regulator C-terminal domain-containing protein [Arthrobacter sp. H5]